MSRVGIREATAEDAAALTALINGAFKPVEAFFLVGDRISLDQCRAHLGKGVFLIAGEEAAIRACVYIEVRGERGYFGMLSVDPKHQGGGLGKRLIEAAEDYCRRAGCVYMDMTVVNLRVELPPFYRRMGYAEDGTMPFPAEVAVKRACHLIKMWKQL